MLMMGATALSTAYVAESQALREYTNTIVALRATAPAHSRSSADSSMSPGEMPGFSRGTSICESTALIPKVFQKFVISLVLISDCPMIAIFIPEPVEPAEYIGATSEIDR